MAKSFFFYDLETSGLSPRDDRIMQFAGIRTDMDLNQVGEPFDVLVKLNDDTLPSPEALMVTGITPQQTQADGYSEAEFAKILIENVFTPDTIVTGFNSIRFDDEFIRHLLWRNFYDPYEWAWKDGRSRWDLLDVTRMTRALRPEGIEWPMLNGKAVNKLELMTKANGLQHTKAHDALSDVEGLIAVTKLIKTKQPQLYEYLLKMRDKGAVKKLINLEDRQPFVYVSGRYDSEFNKATVAFPLTSGNNGTIIVYDLRHDPTPFVHLSAAELKNKLYATWDERQADGFMRIPVKELHYNKAPAVAPLGVLEQAGGWAKVQLDVATIEKHKSILLAAPQFADNIYEVFDQKPAFKKASDPEARLYDEFIKDRDRLRIETVRNADQRQLASFHPKFDDERLPELLVHYKARNFPQTLADAESHAWEEWRSKRIAKQLPGFMKSLTKIAATEQAENKQFVLQEMRLWAESIIPSDTSDQDSEN